MNIATAVHTKLYMVELEIHIQMLSPYLFIFSY